MHSLMSKRPGLAANGCECRRALAGARRVAGVLMVVPSFALAQAATSAAAAPAGPSLGPLLFALLLVLALIPAALWLLKRVGPTQNAQVAGLKVIAQLPLGPRERIIVLEAGDRWLLLGVTAAHIQRIGTLPKGELPPAAPGTAFAALLAKARK